MRSISPQAGTSSRETHTTALEEPPAGISSYESSRTSRSSSVRSTSLASTSLASTRAPTATSSWANTASSAGNSMSNTNAWSRNASGAAPTVPVMAPSMATAPTARPARPKDGNLTTSSKTTVTALAASIGGMASVAIISLWLRCRRRIQTLCVTGLMRRRIPRMIVDLDESHSSIDENISTACCSSIAEGEDERLNGFRHRERTHWPDCTLGHSLQSLTPTYTYRNGGDIHPASNDANWGSSGSAGDHTDGEEREGSPSSQKFSQASKDSGSQSVMSDTSAPTYTSEDPAPPLTSNSPSRSRGYVRALSSLSGSRSDLAEDEAPPPYELK
ncbi:hypothetical protein GY45DRAFT_1364056 [Cubamyces sp. BRFM 1775]|nr:hypothetical protein GY45DRAFT_1364056 [Cubamyces sp. BRFM 1775]